MFGQYRCIKEAFPNFFLDYRENYAPASEVRLTHRIAPDDSWSGNILDFYYKVIRRLTDNLSIPFKLKGIYRDENTPIHIALREALTNTLIHADYYDTASILVIKNENEFIFENPGNTIQPLQNLIQNVTQSEKIDSECRNKTLQDMFRRIQIGEALGSGLHTIYKNWEEREWQFPDLSQQRQPCKTILKLKKIEFFYAETIEKLKKIIPDFNILEDREQRILVHCSLERQINHERIMNIISNIHPKDLTQTLYNLANKGLLKKHGIGRGMNYTLVLSEHEQASLFEKISDSVGLLSDSVDLPSDSVDLPSDSVGLPSDSIGLLSDSIGLPSDSIEFPKKMPLNDLVQHVLKLCRQKPYKISELKKELGRNPDYLRNRILKPLIEKGELSLLYPDKPNSPKQAYKVNEQFIMHDAQLNKETRNEQN